MPRSRNKPSITFSVLPDNTPLPAPGVYTSNDYIGKIVQQLLRGDAINVTPLTDDTSEGDSEGWVTDEEEEINEDVEACLKELNQ